MHEHLPMLQELNRNLAKHIFPRLKFQNKMRHGMFTQISPDIVIPMKPIPSFFCLYPDIPKLIIQENCNVDLHLIGHRHTRKPHNSDALSIVVKKVTQYPNEQLLI